MIQGQAIESGSQREANLDLLAIDRALEIAGVVQYLLGHGLLKKENLFGNVVDLGTGSGAGILALERFGAKQVKGIDRSQEFASFDVSKVLGKKFTVAEACEYLSSLQEDSLSLITSFNTNMEFYEFYREAIRALQPGGQILVTTDIWEMVEGNTINSRRWLRLPIIKLPIAERQAFLQGQLFFIDCSYYPSRDQFVFVRSKGDGN